MKKVNVGRLDNSKLVEVSDESTIEDALEKGGFEVGENEVIHDMDSNEHDVDEDIEHGKAYFLVQRVKSGQY